jgi:hypothetical protein
MGAAQATCLVRKLSPKVLSTLADVLLMHHWYGSGSSSFRTIIICSTHHAGHRILSTIPPTYLLHLHAATCHTIPITTTAR